MAAPSEIGAARGAILDYIQNQKCSISFAIRHINHLYAAGKLPKQLKCNLEAAWQKPRDFVLSLKTFQNWIAERERRGHSLPLIRQKDYSIKPWHSKAWMLKERNPKRKVTEIIKLLNEDYPGVSIFQLYRFYDFMRTEEAKP
jgi:hypothetical protein